jgi:hypothetical protein
MRDSYVQGDMAIRHRAASEVDEDPGKKAGTLRGVESMGQ